HAIALTATALFPAPGVLPNRPPLAERDTPLDIAAAGVLTLVDVLVKRRTTFVGLAVFRGDRVVLGERDVPFRHATRVTCGALVHRCREPQRPARVLTAVETGNAEAHEQLLDALTRNAFVRSNRRVCVAALVTINAAL